VIHTIIKVQSAQLNGLLKRNNCRIACNYSREFMIDPMILAQKDYVIVRGRRRTHNKRGTTKATCDAEERKGNKGTGIMLQTPC